MQRLRVNHLHSDISQYSRQNILEKFRRGQLNALVATDVAARGIDIPEVDLVIQSIFSESDKFYIRSI